MNARRIAEIARGLTALRSGAIYAPIACTALALALFSCSEPPALPQPTPLSSTAVIAAATHVPATPAPQSTSEPTPYPTHTPIPDFVPLPDDAQFTQIAAGKHHACGLQADGTALCWGRNFDASLEVPGGNPSFTRISAGKNFTCGLRIDGAIACWGLNHLGQASPPDGRFDEIAVGDTHACALDEGALICWGGGFPDGAESIQGIPPLSAIQAGFAFTCGLTPDADMACWTVGGELAITPGPFTDIGIGLHHACAIRVNGSAFCVDEYQYHYTQRSSPPPTKLVQISAGWHHACGITESSDIECWGSGVPSAAGERLSAPEGKFAAVSIGWRNSCALNPNGYVTCWQQPDIQRTSEQLLEALGGVEFEQPVELFPLPSGDLAVVERKGIIAAYSDKPNAAHPKTMLDLTDKTICCEYESGMFSAALDPQFEEFPFLYVYYRVVSRHAYGENMPGLASRLARFRVEDGKAVRDSELVILDASLPQNLHYGGAIRFGADGMLYLGIGDNKSSKKAQSLDTLLGNIIRIDVRGATPEQSYRIPPDNPFVNNHDALPEIWAYGLRNPWRMDFAPDGRLFIADVGDYTQDEVSLAAAGANLGWPICEGNACEEGTDADADGLTAPIYTYSREGGCAIIGGVTVPWPNHGFIFGDHCSGKVWLLEQDGRGSWQTRLLARMEGQILSFGMDVDGTVYVLIRRNPIVRLQIDGEE